jgi:hypothetical protein
MGGRQGDSGHNGSGHCWGVSAQPIRVAPTLARGFDSRARVWPGLAPRDGRPWSHVAWAWPFLCRRPSQAETRRNRNRAGWIEMPWACGLLHGYGRGARLQGLLVPFGALGVGEVAVEPVPARRPAAAAARSAIGSPSLAPAGACGGEAEPVAAAVGVHGPDDADAQGKDEGVLKEDMTDTVGRVPREMENERADEREGEGSAEVLREAWDDETPEANESGDARQRLGVFMPSHCLSQSDQHSNGSCRPVQANTELGLGRFIPIVANYEDAKY